MAVVPPLKEFDVRVMRTSGGGAAMWLRSSPAPAFPSSAGRSTSHDDAVADACPGKVSARRPGRL